MTADPVVARADEELKDVVARMLERKISAVIVVDEQKPVGILTDTDMLQLLHTLL